MSTTRDRSNLGIPGPTLDPPGTLARTGGAIVEPTAYATITGYRCSQCGAEDIQRLSVVHESGTTTIDARTRGTSTGIGFARGGMGVGSAFNSSRTTGTQMSALAKRAAPPKARPAMACVVLAIIALIIGRPLVGTVPTLLVVVGFIALGVVFGKYNREVHAGLLAAWRDSWLCHRCGAVSRIGSVAD